jgi:photosystem II stability/assembly factor-like uncharacterized protein
MMKMKRTAEMQRQEHITLALRPGWALPALAALLLASLMIWPSSARATSLDSISFDSNPIDAPAIAVLHPDQVLLETVTMAGPRLVAGGEHGVIIVSDDNGAHWRQVVTPVDVTIDQIRFADRRTGWAVGEFGVVLKTQDGGITWTKQLDGVQAAQLMLSSAEQIAAANPKDSVAAKHVRHAKLFVSDGPDKPFFLVQIFDAQHVRIYGAYGMAFETLDGGAHWADWSSHITDPGYLHPYGLVEQAGVILIVGEQGMLLSGPENGPIKPLSASPYEGSFFGVVQTPHSGLIAYGLQGSVFDSKDFGATWSQVANSSQSTINCAALATDGQVVAGDWDGNVSLVAGAKVVATGTNAGFPIADMVEAPDQSLILVGISGVKRVAATMWQTGLTGTEN